MHWLIYFLFLLAIAVALAELIRLSFPHQPEASDDVWISTYDLVRGGDLSPDMIDPSWNYRDVPTREENR
jgi:hypothetical protein